MAEKQKGMTRAEYDELKKGLLRTFRDQVTLQADTRSGNSPESAIAAAKAASALIALEDHVRDLTLL